MKYFGRKIGRFRLVVDLGRLMRGLMYYRCCTNPVECLHHALNVIARICHWLESLDKVYDSDIVHKYYDINTIYRAIRRDLENLCLDTTTIEEQVNKLAEQCSNWLISCIEVQIEHTNR